MIRRLTDNSRLDRASGLDSGCSGSVRFESPLWPTTGLLIFLTLAVLCWPVAACEKPRSSMGNLAAECADNLGGVGLDSIGPFVEIEPFTGLRTDPNFIADEIISFTRSAPLYITKPGPVRYKIGPSTPDPLRSYPVVDTCFECGEHELLRYTANDTTYMTCWKYGPPDSTYIYPFAPDTSITTKWLPKVQVWLTPEEKTRFDCIIQYGKHDHTSPGGWVLMPGGGKTYPEMFPCTRCNAEVMR